MMLSMRLHRMCSSNAALGFFFCLSFPMAAIFYDLFYIAGTQVSVLKLVEANPIHFILWSLPFIGGVISYFATRKYCKLYGELEKSQLAEQALTYNAFHDALCGLGNRFALNRDFNSIMMECVSVQNQPVLLLLDLDRFKFVNDTLGHKIGDQLLASLAGRLSKLCGTDQNVYRLGGDEFAILWSGAPTAREVNQFCERIVELISEPFKLDRERVCIGVSIGACWLDIFDKKLEECLHRADLALYRAKEKQGSAYAEYDYEMAKLAERRMKCEADLRLAINDNRLFLEYQPIIIGGKHAKISGFEALVRYKEPDGNVILPKEFLSIARRSGLIIAMGKWVIKQACYAACLWPEDMGVSVHATSEQVLDNQFAEFIATCLSDANIAPSRFTIEISEEALILDAERVILAMEKLCAIGVKISLGNFGAGISSISSLQKLPFSQVKIDQSFTNAAVLSVQKGNLVHLMINLIEAYSINSAVEGLESDEQFNFIKNLGVLQEKTCVISSPVDFDKTLVMIGNEKQKNQFLRPEKLLG